jgi:hypothetical protein
MTSLSNSLPSSWDNIDMVLIDIHEDVFAILNGMRRFLDTGRVALLLFTLWKSEPASPVYPDLTAINFQLADVGMMCHWQFAPQTIVKNCVKILPTSCFITLLMATLFRKEGLLFCVNSRDAALLAAVKSVAATFTPFDTATSVDQVHHFVLERWKRFL